MTFAAFRLKCWVLTAVAEFPRTAWLLWTLTAATAMPPATLIVWTISQATRCT